MFLFVASACKSEKTQKISLIPEGFFSFDNQLYFSDGKAFYCTFKSWEHVYELRGNQDQPKHKVIVQEKLSKDMRFINICNTGILTPKFYE